MLLGIDHVALACADPDATADAIERRLGLVATGGGKHDALGTFNRLIWLGDAYLELVGVLDAEVAGRSWLGRLALGALDDGHDGGLVTWAIAVDDLDVTLRWAARDAALVGPEKGERRRADGRMVRWRLVRPDEPSPEAPVLIEHDVRAAEWTPPERAARAAERHPFGGRARLAGLEVLTPSSAVAAGRLRRLLAAAVEPAGRGAVRIRFGNQEARFVTADPSDAALVDLVADVPLRTRVYRIGDCKIRLRGFEAAPPAVPE